MPSRFIAATITALAVPLSVHAQLTVTGLVTDPSGRPLANAQVGAVAAAGARAAAPAVGTATGGAPPASGAVGGATTGEDGRYRLVIRAPLTTPLSLVVRAIGYTPGRATLAVREGTATQNFQLARDVLELSQVVVAGTRVETERAQLGATLATVQGTDIAAAVTPQVDAALSGKIAGALVTQNSGTPGGGTSVRIRGLTTISRAAEPLYIIDGVIVDNGSRQLVDLGGYTTNRLADLDPNDIERIEVVKGAAAAALYGSRANDGVVQIFTKHGRAGTARGSARVTYANDDVLRFVPVNQAPVNLAGQPVTRYDYQNDIFQTGRQVNANVSLSGGDDRTQFFLSGSRQDQTGVERSTSYRRDNVRLNLDRQVTSWLKGSLTTSYIQSNSNLTPNGGLVANYGVLTNFLFMSNDRRLYRDSVTGQFPLGQFQSNPLDVIANWKAPQGVNRYIAGLQLTATPLKDVSVDYRAGYDAFTETASLFIPRGSTSVVYPVGYATDASTRARLQNSDLDVRWVTHPSARLTLTPSVGLNYQRQQYTTTTASAQDLALLTTTVQGSQQFAGQLDDDRRTLGFYGQLQAGISDVLFLTGALRSDASSAFGSNERTQYFPKIGASFDVTGIPGVKDRLGSAISRLRLRAAVGQSGGQPAGSYDRLSNYVFQASGTASGIVNSTRQGNEGLKPERQAETELGFDAEVLSGRAGLEFTHYDRRVSDLILPRTVDPSTGFLDQLANVGTLRNRGFEALLRIVPVQTRRVTWTASGTLTTSDPRVTKLSSGGAFFIPGSFNIVRVATDPGEGSAPGHFYGTTYVRNAQGQILGSIPATATTPRQDSVPIVNAQGQTVGIPYIGPRRVIGNPNARGFYSFINEVQVGRRLSFRGQIDGVRGVDIFNFDRRLLETPAFGSGAAYADEITGKVPRGYFQARRSIFEEYVESGAFAKLRELSVSYDLDPRFLRARQVRGVSITVAGRNLHTWTKYSGWDPETNAGGQSSLVRGFAFATVPIPRTVSASVNVNF